MNSIPSFVKRHALVIFFALAYGISWSLPAFFPVGPFVAAIIVALVSEGPRGLLDILRRCLKWRVGWQPYTLALLVPAAIGITTGYLNSLFGAPVPSAAQTGPWYNLFMLFPLALVDAPIFEEPAWRGYALPRFPASRTPLMNTLLLAVLVVGWHIPRALMEPGITAPYLIAGLGSAVLTNWVYYTARESALLAILYHTTANTFGLYFGPVLSGPDLVRYFWLLAALNVVLAAVVILLTGPMLGRRPVQNEEPVPVVQPSALK